MKKVQLITDGSCIGNPGPGGWACILRYERQQRELTGCNPQTTNNRMELTAAVQGLRTAHSPAPRLTAGAVKPRDGDIQQAEVDAQLRAMVNQVIHHHAADAGYTRHREDLLTTGKQLPTLQHFLIARGS